MTKKILISVVIIVCQITINYAQKLDNESWSQFRGNQRDGASQESGLSNKLLKQGPKLVWKSDIGDGFSELTISKGVVYTMHSQKSDSVSGEEHVAAFNAENGKKIWSTRVDSLFFDTFGDGPRSTPVIGTKNIYSLSSYGKLSANSLKDGKLVWQVDFVKTFGSTLPRWGFSSSPLLVENTLIVEVGGTNSRAFIGFDKLTGKTLWTNGKGNASYNSPINVKIDGKTNIIFANGPHLYSLNTKGDTLWTFKSSMRSPASMPIVFDKNKIFISDLRGGGFIVAEVNKKKVKQLFKAKTMKNDYSSCVYHNGHFYGFNVAALQCVSATDGTKMWTKRGFGKGSLILVGEKLLVLSDKGKLIQIKATSEKYTEQGKFQAIKGKSWTAPSFANGKLFIRNLNEMACYKFK